MKLFILFSLQILSFFNGVAQKSESLIGKWKVVGSFDGNILHDFKTDSVLQLSGDNQRTMSDLVAYTKTTKSIYQNNTYEFTSSGVFRHYLIEDVWFEGQYVIDTVEQLIIATSRDTANKRTEVFKYVIKGRNMDLLIMDRKEEPFANTTFPLIYKLEKVGSSNVK